MGKRKEKEILTIYGILLMIFIGFLMIPLLQLFAKSFAGEGGFSLAHYQNVMTGKGFWEAFRNSIVISSVSAAVSTILAFFLAYTIHYTNLPVFWKKIIRGGAALPMLLPTITYGFAIIYSFGKQGLITKLLGRQFFEIYGFWGLFIGYVIYTLPVSFLLILNTMEYIDKKFMVVSRMMGDSPFRTCKETLLRPLLGTMAASFVQCFCLAFTDYGIPASVGGEYQVVASTLYNEMLGSIPSFERGAVVAIFMLLPSIFGIFLIHYLERYNMRYQKVSQVELPKNYLRDGLCGIGSFGALLLTTSILFVIFLVPFVEAWPYKIQWTMEHVTRVLRDSSLINVYKNSIFVAAMTAIFGLVAAYGAALATARSQISKKLKRVIGSISMITNTVPGMVLGIGYMLCFSGTSLQNSFLLIILCNIIHFFSTPYLMMENSLSKMNTSWENVGALMGDSWSQTLRRVVTPNMLSTILEVVGYYFVNAMVTVSAVIFIAGARTMVITTKIKELQYYTKFNEIFVLSILILATNLLAKGCFRYLANRQRKGETK